MQQRATTHSDTRTRSARRRIQALGARGWAPAVLADWIGIPAKMIERILDPDTTPVSALMHDRIAGLYEQLWDKTPPATTTWQRIVRDSTLIRAADEGWTVPLGWDDIDTDDAPPVTGAEPIIVEIAIELVLHGTPVALTAAERALAVERGRARNLTLLQVAQLLGISLRHTARLDAHAAKAKAA